MSGDGKRSAGLRPQATAPILDFTARPALPGTTRCRRNAQNRGFYGEEKSSPSVLIAKFASICGLLGTNFAI